MNVVDAYGREKELPDSWDQDFELDFSGAFLKPWGNARMHWRREKEVKAAQKHAALTQLRSIGVRPRLPCTIVLQRIATPRSKLDDDNVPDCMKYIRDTIAIKWMGLKSDNKPGLKFLYGQQPTSRKGYLAVRVTIIQHEERTP